MFRITGRVEVIVNGDPVLNKTGAVANGIGESGKTSFERKTVMGQNGIHGFVEEPVEPSLEVTITDREDKLLGDYAAINGDGTVIFRTAGGGKEYTLVDATCTQNLKITAGEGEVPLKFIGSKWNESVSNT